MKINGLKMINYWKVSFVFNYMHYLFTLSTFLFFGKYVSALQFFVDGNMFIILHTYLAWGLNQVSLSFLVSCFLTDSQTSSIIGYAFSIIMTIAAATFCTCGGVYDVITGELLLRFYWLPQFPMCRIMFILTE